MKTATILIILIMLVLGVMVFGFSLIPPNLIYVYKYGSAAFSVGDIENLDGLAWRLKEKKWPNGQPDPVSDFIYGQLDEAAREALDRYMTATAKINDRWSDSGHKELKTVATTMRLESTFVTNLNGIIHGPCIYEKNRFQGIELDSHTKFLLQRNPQGEDLVRLNWLLLKDAYPELLMGTIEADGDITGIFIRKERILHIKILTRKLSEEELQDIWVALSPTNRIALADITEDMLKPYAVNHYTFEFNGNKLVRFEAEVYGRDYSSFKEGNTISLGSLRNKSTLTLPCSVEGFEKVFGEPDEIDRMHMW